MKVGGLVAKELHMYWIVAKAVLAEEGGSSVDGGSGGLVVVEQVTSQQDHIHLEGGERN